MPQPRLATKDDLEAIVALTTEYRRRLAGWAPVWWRASAGADQIHPMWLQHLLESDGPILRVVEEGGVVTGCAASMPRDGHWLVDDVAVIDDLRWRDAGVALLEAIPERPALTAVPTADTARALASELAGQRQVSSYWLRATQPGEWTSQPLHSGLDVPAAPPHTFGGDLDPWADGALAFADGADFVVGSASMAAPPVYDPGGTVCVVDRVVGTDRAGLLRSALAAAAHRGDVVLNVVAAPDDVDLQNHLARAGFERTVDVFAWQ